MSRKTEEAQRELRRKQVAANLLAGLNYREMASVLGCGIGTINRDVNEILRQWREENVDTADRWIQLQIKRLDRAINALWGKVEAGDVAAITSLQAVIKQQGQLMGYEKLLAQLHLNVNFQDLPDDVIARIANGEDVDLATIARAGRTGKA